MEDSRSDKFKLNIQSIFHSIDGEVNGFQGAGQLSTFIRLKGCNLKCHYCDTAYSQSAEPANWMTFEEIAEQIKFPKITITGGEPLLNSAGVEEFCKFLLGSKKLFWVEQISIETNGTIIPDFIIWDEVRVVIDYKLSSSGMEHKTKYAAFDWLHPQDIIKFVISDWKDYDRAVELIKEFPEWRARKVFSPAISYQTLYDHTFIRHPDPTEADEVEVVDPDWPRQLAERMIKDEVPAQFSLQIHKLLWPGATEEH